jgi:hypothetical protein
MVGEPCAGNPQARFDEGEQETGLNRCRACSLLYQSALGGSGQRPAFLPFTRLLWGNNAP